MVVWLLIGVILTKGGVASRTEMFETQKSCEIAAAQEVEALVSSNINNGSVTCQRVVIGEFA